MAKATFNDIGTLSNPASARQALNDNFQKIEDEFEKVLYRDGSTPNSMEADLDMDSHRILNVADAVHDKDAVNKGQVEDIAYEAAEVVWQPRFDDFVNHVEDELSRTLKLPSGYTNMSLPAPEPSRLIGWNAAGTALRNTDLSGPGDLMLRSDLADPTGGAALVQYNAAETVKDRLDALGSGGGAALVGFQQAGSGAVQRNAQDKLREIDVSVKDFGAVGDGATNDSPAFQAAVNYVSSRGGGTIRVPHGVYRFDSAVTINRGGITIAGDSVLEEFLGPHGSTVPHTRGNGSWILLGATGIHAFNITTGANNIRLTGLGFDQPKPAIGPGWTPTTYGTCIRIQGSGACILDHLFFFGVSSGIDIGALGSATGRTRIEHIWGEFFDFGIRVQFAADVVRINDYHQYPFWSVFNANVAAYTQAYTYGVMSYRNDNCQITNLFVLGVWRGLYLATSADGATNKMLVANADLDACTTGVLVDGNGITASMTNIQCQPGPNTSLPNSRGIFINGNSNNLMLSNLRVARTNAEAMYVQGTDNIVGIANCYIDNWDDTLTGVFTAISSTSATNQISLSGSIKYFTGAGLHGAFLGGELDSYRWPQAARGLTDAVAADGGVFTVTHNLGFTPSQVFTQLETNYPYHLTVTAKDATTFTVVARDLSAAGAPVVSAGTAITLRWVCAM
ncbi:MAG TPA: glycosyl hydrolase family 28-related protein [Methylophilaceae bacterium]